MKKIRNILKVKTHQAARHRKAQRRRKGSANRLRAYLATAYSIKNRKSTLEILPAPENFSMANNPVAVVDYIALAETRLRRKQNVLLEFEKITAFTPETIPYLISHVTNFGKTYDATLTGRSPLNPEFRRIFALSGFYDHVRSTIPLKERFKSPNILFQKTTNFKVENNDARRACVEGVKHTFNDGRKFSPLYEIIIELMANTNNHASLAGEGRYKWWLYVYKHEDQPVTSFAFLDLGVGVFKSFASKSMLEELMLLFSLADNSEIIKKMFEGKAKSRTNLVERGKGMPSIYENSKHPEFEDFIFLSDDVFYNLKTDQATKLNKRFSGTYFYWKLVNPES